MEPLKINVNIEVGLKQTTLEALAVIFNPWKGCACADTFPQPDPQPEPQPEPEAPAPVEDDDDLPPSNAELAEKAATAAVPTEAEMRAAIQATRKRGVAAKTIRQYIHDTFGVETSVECPENRRQELIDGLANLAA